MRPRRVALQWPECSDQWYAQLHPQPLFFPPAQVGKTVHWDTKVLPYELVQRTGVTVTQEGGGGRRTSLAGKEYLTKAFMEPQSVVGEFLLKDATALNRAVDCSGLNEGGDVTC